MKAFPRLALEESRLEAQSVVRLSVEEARSVARTDFRDAMFPPSGGRQVAPSDLTLIASLIRSVATESGYPQLVGRSDKARFDARVAVNLHKEMEIGRSEASEPGIWSFLCIRVLPDIVHWRFGPGPSADRFLGRNRGVRNALGRLWWRAELLASGGDAVDLALLGEDQIVQIAERPTIASNVTLAREIARQYLRAAEGFDGSSELLMRETIKRLRRKGSFLEFAAMPKTLLDRLIAEEFNTTKEALS